MIAVVLAASVWPGVFAFAFGVFLGLFLAVLMMWPTR